MGGRRPSWAVFSPNCGDPNPAGFGSPHKGTTAPELLRKWWWWQAMATTVKLTSAQRTLLHRIEEARKWYQRFGPDARDPHY
jgi:hypothetical protein